MKKTSILGLLLLAFMPLFAEHVDPETARKVATTFLSNNGAKSDQLTDLSKSAGFPNLYIFTTEESFVVMAADDCVKPILGYSLTEKFITDDMPDNIRWWLQGYSDQIQDVKDSHQKANHDITRQWKDLREGTNTLLKSRTEVGPMITTKWNQNYPYNLYCPTDSEITRPDLNGHVPTGCVATAMAQVIKYHNHPAQGIGSHSYLHNTYGIQSADFGATIYDWNNMPNQISSSSPIAQQQAVATLIRHCGIAVEMDYGKEGSGALPHDITPALKSYFNFSQTAQYVKRSEIMGNNQLNTFYTDEEWIALIQSELDAGRPIIYGGFSNTTSGSGHSFVCDGYGKDGYDNDWFHFNWGWNGNYNGYYSINNMTPGSGGIGGGAYDYSYRQDAVIGIKPSTNSVNPSDLTYTLNGTSLTLNWSCDGDVSSFNIYSNGNLIGNVSTNSYLVPIPYGTNVYFVQSVNADGELSLSSNRVTVTVDYPTPIVEDLSTTIIDNNVSFSWTASDWCYPETPSATLTYGNGIYSNTIGTIGQANMYWGQRFPAEDLAIHQGKVIYKISIYVTEVGTYDCILYKGSNSSSKELSPKTQITTFPIYPSTKGWFDIILDETVEIDDSQDLWVFFHDTELKLYPAAFCDDLISTEGNYYSADDPLTSEIYTLSNTSWLIRTYLTDGAYTYNLYQDGEKIGENLTSTSYSNVSLSDNKPNLFTVTTNYYGGEAESNTVGFAKGDAELSTLEMEENDKMTLLENSTLTVGTLSNSDPANLVLENGAQLITSSEDVKATVNRTITTFTGSNDKGNWHLIASPMTDEFPISNTSLISETESNYDLYIFDQNYQGQEWRNFKGTGEGHFSSIKNKVGYLYASAENTNVSFAGTLNNTDGQVAIAFTDDKALSGYNLVGNPFPCEATIDKGDYYRIVETEEGSKLQLASSAIAPMEGIIVKAANSDDQTVTFSKTTAKGTRMSSGMITMSVSRERGQALDIARIRLEGDLNWEKINLHKGGTQLFIPQDSTDYAMVVKKDQTAIPVSFKASQDGIYTLDIEIEGLDLDYLHLIDNIAGTDIDLLTTTSYTFEAKNDDYMSRFRLLFSAFDEDQTDELAEGNIQILDVTGRVVRTYHGNMRCVPTEGMAPGVYVLRSVNGNETKTEKIIIK